MTASIRAGAVPQPEHRCIRGWAGQVALFHGEPRNRRHVPRHAAQRPQVCARRPRGATRATRGHHRPVGWTSRCELSSEVDTSEIRWGAP